VWLEKLHQLNIPMTPSGIAPIPLRLVAQCLNLLHHYMHSKMHETKKKDICTDKASSS
jgi:hypothetical protein